MQFGVNREVAFLHDRMSSYCVHAHVSAKCSVRVGQDFDICILQLHVQNYH